MRLLLHAGMPKTGSTALQSSFLAGHKKLLAAGVYYPRPLRGPIHNASLCLRLSDERYPTLVADWEGGLPQARASGQAVLNELAERCKRAEFDTVILSSELIASGYFAADEMVALQALLAPLSDDIETIVYVREPAAYYLSYFQESLKSQVALRRPHAMHVQRPWANLRAAFGRAPVLCAYDRAKLVNGDIVDDFLARFLPGRLPAGALKSVRDNSSLSAEGILVLAQVRAILAQGLDGRKEEFTVKMIQTIRKVETTLGLKRPRLRPDIAAAIRRASTDLLWLRDDHGITFEDVDYAEIDGHPIPPEMGDRPIEEIIEIDMEKCDALANAIMSKLISGAITSLGAN